MKIPFDQIQRARVHLLDLAYKSTICGVPLRKKSLTRTNQDEVVFGSLATFIELTRDNSFLDDFLQASFEDSAKPYLCEVCLASEAPNLGLPGKRDAWGAIKGFWAKHDRLKNEAT